MKTIGLLGGMSWESTLVYYRLINEGVKSRMGGLHSAKIVLHSVDFGPVEELMRQGRWPEIADILMEGVRRLEMGGADCFLICTNTMHKLAADLEKAVSIPLLHIADASAEVLTEKKAAKVGLLGTSFTMEQEFYHQRLNAHGLEVITPGTEQRERVNDIIFSELCLGKVLEASKKEYIDIIKGLQQRGAQAILLGCTEIGMLVQQSDVQVELVDTTPIHAAKAVEFALASDG